MSRLQEKHLADLAVSTGKIQDDAVTGDKIADSVALAGSPTTSTASSGDNTTKIATTAFVKGEIDSAVEGLKPKAAVRAATTGSNIDLANDLENADTLDGVTLATGDRVLVKDQTAAEDNGIYIVAASGAASRSADFNAVSEINGAYVPVQEGTVNAGKNYVQFGTVATLGTDDIEFTFFNGATTLSAGDGIDIAASTISVDLKASAGLKIDTTELAVEPADFAGTGLEDDGSDNLRLAAQGNGIAGGAGSTLSVQADTAETSTTLASAINVSSNGVAVRVDDSTLEGSGQGAAGAEDLRIKAGGVDTTQLATGAVTTDKLGGTSVTAAKLGSDVAGDGLSGGNGAAIDLNLNASGGLETNTDELGINVDSTNNTTSINGSNELVSLRPGRETVTLAGADITNQYVDLAEAAHSAASISFVPVGGIEQDQGVDYTISLTGGAGGVTRITFAGDMATGGDAALVATDKIIIKYDYL